MNENLLELVNINKTFAKGTVNESVLFRDFSLTVSRGEFVSVIGSNGSGKTTALNIISASLPADSGKVILANDDISSLPEYKRARRIARVFQDPSSGTVGSMSIAENMALAEGKGRRALLTPAEEAEVAE